MATVRYTNIEGQIVAEKRGGVRTSYVPDAEGSTLALAGPYQALTDTFSYWPYGEASLRTGTTGTPFKFTGTLGYHTSGQHLYVRARTLSPRFGRWTSTDPIRFPSWGISLYAYVRNNPASLVDPSGRIPKGCDSGDKKGKSIGDCCRDWNKLVDDLANNNDPRRKADRCKSIDTYLEKSFSTKCKGCLIGKDVALWLCRVLENFINECCPLDLGVKKMNERCTCASDPVWSGNCIQSGRGLPGPMERQQAKC